MNTTPEEQDLLITAARVVDTVLREPNAQRHLREGYMRRFFLMQTSLAGIEHLIEIQADNPLDHEHSTNLDIYLNSYYFNLSGSLDNLAWMLAWELELMENLNEADMNSRRFCNLFRNEFLTTLAERNPEIAAFLVGADYRTWYREVKDLRDPIAHRIPLTFAQSTLEPSEAKEYHDAYEQRNAAIEAASRAFQSGDIEAANRCMDQALEHMARAETLGKFIPIIVTSEVSGRQIRSAKNQLRIDHTKFIAVSHAVLNVFLL